MDVDPIIPPIEGAGIVAEIGLFVGRESGAEAFDVGSFEDVIVVQDEGFEERDELDDFLEFAFLAGQRRLRGERFGGAIDGLYDSFLRWGRDGFVARFGNGDGVEARAHTLVEIGVGAIKFSVA